MILQMFVAFIAVICFSVTLEVNKKLIVFAGLTGAVGWIVYLIGIKFGMTVTIASLISALSIAIISYIFSKIFHVLTTIFLVPGILPIVPGIAMYRMVYYFLIDDMQQAKLYLFQAITVAGAIALGIFVIESLDNIKVHKKISEEY